MRLIENDLVNLPVTAAPSPPRAQALGSCEAGIASLLARGKADLPAFKTLQARAPPIRAVWTRHRSLLLKIYPLIMSGAT
jgi:hypothetical protein